MPAPQLAHALEPNRLIFPGLHLTHPLAGSFKVSINHPEGHPVQNIAPPVAVFTSGAAKPATRTFDFWPPTVTLNSRFCPIPVGARVLIVVCELKYSKSSSDRASSVSVGTGRVALQVYSSVLSSSGVWHRSDSVQICKSPMRSFNFEPLGPKLTPRTSIMTGLSHSGAPRPLQSAKSVHASVRNESDPALFLSSLL